MEFINDSTMILMNREEYQNQQMYYYLISKDSESRARDSFRAGFIAGYSHLTALIFVIFSL